VFVVLGCDGTVRERTVQLSTICVSRRLSYQDADEYIREGGPFSRLYEVLMRARQLRVARGASNMLVPELQVRVERDRQVVLSVRERETPAQALVAECMIVANHSAALFLDQHSVPSLYRTQKAGRRAAEAQGEEQTTLQDRLQRRYAFNRTMLNTRPGDHAGLGVDCYCSTTSPMRKYLDLVVQRQLVAVLQSQEPVYTQGDLRTIAAKLQPVLTRVSQVENERRRYWLLRKMEPLQGSALRAIITARRRKGYTVLLPEFLFELNAGSDERSRYEPGEEVQVLIEAIDAFSGSISARLVEIST
jgi:exoribonuclease-2